jgi:SAM-dependent MidA family methyltransferase
MHEALYHRAFGYYTANIREFGRRGDFTTWPTLNKDLGRAIGRWALENKPAGRWNLIEIGAGSGELAAAVMKRIGWWNRARYHIVEISPRLKKAQQDHLGSSAIWHATILEALAASDGAALIFSNELVDAFPCRVFQRCRDNWRELALCLKEGRVLEEWMSRPLPESTAFSHSWPEAQRVEVHESYQAWLQEWFPAWQAGSMLTVDYGDTCPALYLRRPAGTLRAYAHHQRLEGKDVYACFGLRDLTADVNFSDLRREPTFSSTIFTTLAEFISKHLPSVAKNHAAQILHLPGGAGEAFKVLVQTR